MTSNVSLANDFVEGKRIGHVMFGIKLICLLFIIFDFSDIVSYCIMLLLYDIISCFCRTIFVDFIHHVVHHVVLYYSLCSL